MYILLSPIISLNFRLNGTDIHIGTYILSIENRRINV